MSSQYTVCLRKVPKWLKWGFYFLFLSFYITIKNFFGGECLMQEKLHYFIKIWIWVVNQSYAILKCSLKTSWVTEHTKSIYTTNVIYLERFFYIYRERKMLFNEIYLNSTKPNLGKIFPALGNFHERKLLKIFLGMKEGPKMLLCFS